MYADDEPSAQRRPTLAEMERPIAWCRWCETTLFDDETEHMSDLPGFSEDANKLIARAETLRLKAFLNLHITHNVHDT